MNGSKATIIAPFWTSATWWHLLAPDSIHLSNYYRLAMDSQERPLHFRLGVGPRRPFYPVAQMATHCFTRRILK